MSTTTTTRWAPTADPYRVRFLRSRFALSEPAAQLLAPMIFGEARQ